MMGSVVFVRQVSSVVPSAPCCPLVWEYISASHQCLTAWLSIFFFAFCEYYVELHLKSFYLNDLDLLDVYKFATDTFTEACRPCKPDSGCTNLNF